MDDIQAFCRQIRARSTEHCEAMRRANAAPPLPGQMASILRQELDSMVRVIFLLAQRNRDYRHELIAAAINGNRWTVEGSHRPVTDRQMVELAQNFHNWTSSVYRFGCAFIHLSNMHDHGARDPLQALSEKERRDVLGHLRYYHGGPCQPDPTFRDIVPLLPKVLEKIASNLECYLRELEEDRDLEGSPA